MVAETTANSKQVKKVKFSSRFPHLSFTLEHGVRGEVICTFREGSIYKVYELVNGEAIFIDCSDRGVWDDMKTRHVRNTAAALAAKLTARKAA